MKTIEKQEARRLRQEEGLSLTKISDILNVSKSSVSLWVRDIQLTDRQRSILLESNPVYNNEYRGANNLHEKHKNIRLGYQKKGREKIKEQDPEYIAGCMLYWAEGTKSKNSLKFTNSDIGMMRVFINFIKNQFDLENKDISLRIHCFTDVQTVEEIESYWLSELSLPKSCLRKTMVNHYSKSSQKKRTGKSKYGTCNIMVHKTEIVQEIFGAIQEYSQVDKPEWLVKP